MVDYVTLLGAEQVQNAASHIRGAAEQITSAASQMDWTSNQQRQFMDDWLMRYETITEKLISALERLNASPKG